MIFTIGCYMFICGIVIHEAFVNKWPVRGAKTISELFGVFGIIMIFSIIFISP